MTEPLVIATLTLLSSLAAYHAQAKDQPSHTVGSVYGKAVTAADIGLTMPIDPADQFDARDEAKWNLMGRVMEKFGSPVMDRFIAQKKIDATADEIAAFGKYWRKSSEKALRESEGRLVKVKEELAAPDLPNEKKEKLEKEQATLEVYLPEQRKFVKDGPPEDMARSFIVPWKIERDLHRTYGGRVIFQQFGPEALDARRRLIEEAEKKGDMKFDDAGVRHLFYYYANMRHTVVDEKALERPWFLGEGR